MAHKIPTALREEWFLGFSWVTSLAFLFAGNWLLSGLAAPVWLALVFLWLFVTVMGSAMAVVRHADHMAERLGEPYGTLLLTLSVTFIEVASISAVMLHGENQPTLARDTLVAVVMIILNGMTGLALLVGAWRHREQAYNLQGANVYLGVIIPLVVLSLILPNFTHTTSGPTLSDMQQMVLVLAGIGLYVTFLSMQTGRYRGYFSLGDAVAAHHGEASGRLWPHAVLLLAYIVPVVFLAEQFAHPVDFLLETLQAPVALGGVIMALLVATPEAISAVRAAAANQLQRSVNIFLGSVLSTIGLTVPVMVLVSRFTGREIVLGVESTDVVLLPLTLFLCVVTFASGRTNVIQGAVHLVLFAVYLLLIVQG